MGVLALSATFVKPDTCFLLAPARILWSVGMQIYPAVILADLPQVGPRTSLRCNHNDAHKHTVPASDSSISSSDADTCSMPV